jgi:4-aminobutyrate aminotransferase-like enzyme
MTKPEEVVRKVIDDVVLPRLQDYRTYLLAARPHGIPVARADLLYLWDEYRTEYLDWATATHPLGHGHPIVTAAVVEHHRYYGHTGPQSAHVHRWPVEYAKRLSGQFSGQGDPMQVLFCEGEREAVFQAVTAALAVTERATAVVLDTGWHDWVPHAHHADREDLSGIDWSRHGALLLALADTQGRVLPAGQARRWMLAAREHKVPVIVDETVTGFGRLGTMWGQQRTALTADLTVLGGAAGGGYPLGAVIGTPEFFPATDPDVSSQAGNPIACCAGAATLTATELGVLAHMEETGKLLDTGLTELTAQFDHHLAGNHGEGLWRGLQFTTADTARRFTLDCRAQGLYVAPAVGDVVVLAPTLITSTNEMTRGVDLIAATLLSWDDET